MTLEYIIQKLNEAEECMREIDNVLLYDITNSTNMSEVDDLLAIKEKTRPIFNAIFELELTGDKQ